MPRACEVVMVAGVPQLELLGFELFELIPDAVLVVDRQGVIRYANRQAGRLFGQEPVTLVSTPVEALLPEHLRKRHIVHRTKFTSSEPSMRPMGTGLDLAGRRADGTTFPVDIMLNPLKHLAEPMVLAVVRDVTDRRAAEEALRQSRSMFEKFYEQSPDAIIVVDEIGRIDRVNAPAEALFGFSREHLLGQSIETLLPERFRGRHSAHRGSYIKDAKTRPMGTDLQLFGQRADGSEFPVDIMLSPIEIDQRRLVLAVVRDVTERKSAEAHVQLLMREINHRAKNMLSVVHAIARQTATKNPKDFIECFSERIQALSANQNLLVRNEWNGVEIEDLVRAHLAPFADHIGSRIAVHGPKLRLSAASAQAIGLALHELTTNAGKYGALSINSGRVDIRWGYDRDTFTMSWNETNGPPVSAPERSGFGTIVMGDMAKHSVDGTVDLDYPPSGLTWRLTCPAANALEY